MFFLYRGVFINRYSGKKTSVNLKLPLFRPVRFAALEKTAGVSRFALVWKAMRRVLAMPHCHPHGPPKPYWPRMAWSFAQRTDLFVSFPCCAAWFQPRRGQLKCFETQSIPTQTPDFVLGNMASNATRKHRSEERREE